MFQAAQKLGGYELVSARMCTNAFFLRHPGPSLPPSLHPAFLYAAAKPRFAVTVFLRAQISQIAHFCPRWRHGRRRTRHLRTSFV